MAQLNVGQKKMTSHTLFQLMAGTFIASGLYLIAATRKMSAKGSYTNDDGETVSREKNPRAFQVAITCSYIGCGAFVVGSALWLLGVFS